MPTRLAPPRAVVADPHPECGETLVDLMRAHGWIAHAARSGEQALALVRMHHPRIFVTEADLGDMTAAGLAARVRELEGLSLVIVMLTAWDRDSDLRAAMQGGFDGFFVKPADPRALLVELQKLYVEGELSRTQPAYLPGIVTDAANPRPMKR